MQAVQEGIRNYMLTWRWGMPPESLSICINCGIVIGVHFLVQSAEQDLQAPVISLAEMRV